MELVIVAISSFMGGVGIGGFIAFWVGRSGSPAAWTQVNATSGPPPANRTEPDLEVYVPTPEKRALLLREQGIRGAIKADSAKNGAA